MRVDDRAGFTMVEVLVAMTILGITVLSLQAAFTARFVSEVGRQDLSTVANQHAQTRLEEIRMHPNYATLDGTFEEARRSLPGRGSFRRTTVVSRTQRRTGSRQLDFTTVTVVIESPALNEPLRRTAVVGAP